MPDQAKIQAPGLLWVEEGDEKLCEVAEVAPVLPISKTYTYSIPEPLRDSLQVGQRVIVPMGKKATPRAGFVVRRDRIPWDNTLRPIESVVDSCLFLSEHLVAALAPRVSENYAAPLGTTLKALTPEDVRKGAGLQSLRLVSLVGREEGEAIPEDENAGAHHAQAVRCSTNCMTVRNRCPSMRCASAPALPMPCFGRCATWD